MPSPLKARLAFILALILLTFSGGAAYLSILQLRHSESLVAHTLEVQAALGAMDSSLGTVGRARTAYVTTHQNSFLQIFQDGLPAILNAAHHICILTRDNPAQKDSCQRLEALAERRVELFERSVTLARLDPKNTAAQDEITRLNVPVAQETTDILLDMRQQEQRLLQVRTHSAAHRFTLVGLLLALAFILALIFLFVHYRFLSLELRARRRAEQQARDSEEGLELALDSAQMGVWDLDLVRNVCKRSPRHDEIFGYSSPQPIWTNETFYSHVHPEDREMMQANFEEACKIGFFLTECRIVWNDQSLHWVSVQGRVYRDDQGRPIRMMGVIADITERKKSEEFLVLRNTQLQAVNQELEAFSYSVSHDLRSPLRAIDGFSLALMEDYEPNLPEEAKEYLQRIRAAANRMGNLIDDLLNLARTTRREMARRRVNLSELAQEIVAQMELAYPEMKAKFYIQPDLYATADPSLLKVALENLFDNARKFSSKRPDPHVEFGARQQNSHAVYFIRDNGVGFDMTYVDKIFSTFQRLHQDHEFPGTGVGLASVHRVIQRHGGQIWAESSEGDGATFYFTLEPKADEQAA